MGKAQEMVRHGCGRIVPSNGLCGPCLERDRAQSAAVLSDGKTAFGAQKSERFEELIPFEGGVVVGTCPTMLASDAASDFELSPYIHVRPVELVIQSPALEWLDISQLRFGTIYVNVSRAPIPCASVGKSDVFRWRLRGSDAVGRPYQLLPGVGGMLRLHNRGAGSVLVRAALFCEKVEERGNWDGRL